MTLNFENAKPAIFLMVGFLVFSIMVTVGVSRLDATVYYQYVGTFVSDCWGSNTVSPAGNQNPICLHEYSVLGIVPGHQDQIGQPYWTAMNQNLSIIAGAFGGVWLLTTLVLDYVRRTKPDPISWYTTFVIAATIELPVLSGMGDYFYFIWLKVPIPSTWSWLDGMGILPYITKNITHHPDVLLQDMYIAMFLGVVAIIALWSPIILAFAHAKKSKIIDLF